MASAARLRTVLLALVGLLAALLVTPGPAAQAADDKRIVTGGITCPKLSRCPGLKLLWFDKDWNYIGERNLGKAARGYSINLVPGTYHLQLVDQRPSYDVSKYAPTDATVTVRSGSVFTERNFTMRKGGAITGTAVNGNGGKLGGAKIVAANTGRQSFSTTANKKGQFAVGGLPQGKYSVFTYDRSKVWVGKSDWAGAVKPGQAENVRIRLTKRAGDLSVYLTIPGAKLLKDKTTLTVTSKATGQWWSTTSGTGNFTFKGLYPGAYTAQFNGAGVWFAKTGAVTGSNVRPNGFDRGEFKLTKRGGWLTGHILDGGAPEMIALKPPYANAGARIQLFNADGDLLATAESDDEGRFRLDGQLATQDGLTVVVDPSPDAGGWMNGEGYCQFEHAEFDGYSMRTGEESYIGQLPIPRTPGSQNPSCAAPESRR
jgi:hypothetical protein